jgi:CheY-like chemotaxis protein
MRDGKLDGVRVFLVEDEAMVAMLIEDMLADLGCVVIGLAATAEGAIRKISTLSFDAAILDINLSGADSYPVASALTRAGTPFLFSTGYGAGAIPDTFRRVPVLTKPFTAAHLERTLASVLAKPEALSDAG